MSSLQNEIKPKSIPYTQTPSNWRNLKHSSKRFLIDRRQAKMSRIPLKCPHQHTEQAKFAPGLSELLIYHPHPARKWIWLRYSFGRIHNTCKRIAPACRSRQKVEHILMSLWHQDLFTRLRDLGFFSSCMQWCLSLSKRAWKELGVGFPA